MPAPARPRAPPQPPAPAPPAPARIPAPARRVPARPPAPIRPAPAPPNLANYPADPYQANRAVTGAKAAKPGLIGPDPASCASSGAQRCRRLVLGLVPRRLAARRLAGDLVMPQEALAGSERRA